MNQLRSVAFKENFRDVLSIKQELLRIFTKIEFTKKRKTEY